MISRILKEPLPQLRLVSLFRLILSAVLVLSLAGCATSGSRSPDYDRFEGVNRSIHRFNMAGDRVLFRPLAQIYDDALPDPAKTGIRNVFNNLWEPATVVNDLLQGKPAMAGRDMMRFVINTTFGILGLFDVAHIFGLPRREEDFGQTLAVWGVPSGPYVVLPFLGPSTLRDTFGTVVRSVYTDALAYAESPDREYATVLRIISGRARLLPADDILAAQPDQYLFIREAWTQQRNLLIHDGQGVSDDPENSEEGLIKDLLEE
ncbi:MAG: VacJ family lipoprotein [Gammaproteobacteria bacterium]|nr:VacJ family lipoprotein [Gammaproteobacteria bacterium]MYD75537.1 VacJ family lipoprotein [Gammaproteobacteria bacterium]MYJ53211.1 VacJ family lipoprotein [Gammaproteobacteria bacterium]